MRWIKKKKNTYRSFILLDDIADLPVVDLFHMVIKERECSAPQSS